MCRNTIIFNKSTDLHQLEATNNNEFTLNIINDAEPQEPTPIIVLHANNNATLGCIAFIFTMLFICLYEISS